jgi:ribosomal protein L11 methyltransferase
VDGGFAVYADDDGEAWLRAELAVVAAAPLVEGWEDGWRSFHHGVVVGRFWVGPPWEDAPPGADPIVVDPGRAFGTGAHPTTRLTLELLQEEPAVGALLDVGCGSGVLSVAAARLGFSPVLGLDVDEAAIEATRANARVNGVAVTAARADALADALPKVRLVVANVALDVVQALLPRLQAPRAVTSGYLDRDRPDVAGWRHVARREREGWAADLLERL